jgi:hypothetical protein
MSGAYAVCGEHGEFLVVFRIHTLREIKLHSIAALCALLPEQLLVLRGGQVFIYIDLHRPERRGLCHGDMARYGVEAYIAVV